MSEATPSRGGGVSGGGVTEALCRGWRAHGVTSTGFALLVLTCVFLAVAGPRADVALRTGALRQALSIASPTARSVYGTIDATALDADIGERPTSADIAGIGTLLRSKLAAGKLPLSSGDWGGLATPQFTVTAGLPAALMTTKPPPEIHLIYRDNLAEYGTLSTGTMPAKARAFGPTASFEVAVTAATAAKYQLRPGSRIEAGLFTLTVTGIITADRTDAAFWSADPELAAPLLTTPTAPPGGQTPPPYWSAAVFIGAAELPVAEQTMNMPTMTVSWDFPIDVGALSADAAAPLNAALQRTLTVDGILNLNGGNGGSFAPVALTSGISPILTVFSGQDSSAATVLRLLAVSLAVIGIVTVLLGAQALTRRREAERALLAARGGSRWQIALAATRATAIPALPGAVAGALLALAVPGDGGALSWSLALVTLAAALGCGPVLALRGYRGNAAGRSGTGRGGASRGWGWRRAAVEGTLTVLAVASLVLLRSGSGGSLTSLAPVLAAVPAAIIVTRLYPLAATALAAAARQRRGVTLFTGLAGAARGAQDTLIPGFALVLALTVGGFGFLVRDAVVNDIATASWQQVGSDLTVDAQLASQLPSAATVRAVSAVPGVRAVALASLVAASANSSTLSVAVVQPTQYAALTAGTGLPAFPAAALAAPGSGNGTTMPALLTSAGIGNLPGVGSNITLTVGLKSFNVLITGAVAGLPGVADNSGTTTALGGGSTSVATNLPELVLPAWALGDGAAGAGSADGPGAILAPANFLLVTGTVSPRLLAVVHRELPGLPADASTERAPIAAALAATPLAHDEYLAIVFATVAAAVLAAFVLFITIAEATRARRATVGRLRLMGTSARKGWLTELAQTLPLIIAAAIGGAAAALVLGPLAGPALNLAVFTGTGETGPAGSGTAGGGAGLVAPVSPQWAPIAVGVAGLIVLAVAALAATTAAAAGLEEETA